jgi:hypothetical protein
LRKKTPFKCYNYPKNIFYILIHIVNYYLNTISIFSFFPFYTILYKPVHLIYVDNNFCTIFRFSFYHFHTNMYQLVHLIYLNYRPDTIFPNVYYHFHTILYKLVHLIYVMYHLNITLHTDYDIYNSLLQVAYMPM